MEKTNEWLVHLLEELLRKHQKYEPIDWLEIGKDVGSIILEASRRKEIETLEWCRDTAEIEPIVDAINARLKELEK